MLIVDNRKITVALCNHFDLPTADVNALDTDTDTDSDSDVKVEPNPIQDVFRSCEILQNCHCSEL